MSERSNSELHDRWFRHDVPLGPIASPTYDRALITAHYHSKNRVHNEASERLPSILLGRKGAGKSALLLGPLAGEEDSPNLIVLSDNNLFAAMRRAEEAHARVFGHTFVHHGAEIWIAVFWHVSIAHTVRTAAALVPAEHLSLYRSYLHAIEHPTLSTDDPSETDAADHDVRKFLGELTATLNNQTGFASLGRILGRIGRPFSRANLEQCKSLVIKDLKALRRTYTIAIDSLEDLQHQQDVLRESISALFSALGRNAAVREPAFRVRVCFPAESHGNLTSLSANPEKDFGRVLLMRWSARELVEMASVRYGEFLKFRYPNVSSRVEEMERGGQIDRSQMIRLLLPDPSTFRNAHGGPEDPLAYVLRHTQLLPRHLMLILNLAIMIGLESGNLPFTLPSECLIDAVREGESQISAGIFSAYQASYPYAKNLCNHGLEGLHSTFTVSDLEAHFRDRRVRRATAIPFFEGLNTLIDMGAIGAYVGETDRYVIAKFSYTFADPGRRVISTLPDSRLAVHAIFSGMFGGPHLSAGARVPVYPYGCDLDDDYRKHMS